MSATPKFEKRQPGLYATGIWQPIGSYEYLWCPECWDAEFEDGVPVTVELQIDAKTSTGRGWDIRHVCRHGHFTDSLGEWYRTLGDAKASLMAGNG
jgi:hypothetical protein